MASIVCPCGGWYPRPTSTHDRGDTSRDTTSFIERTPCFFSGKNLHIAGLENLFRLACNQEGKLGRKKGQGGWKEVCTRRVWDSTRKVECCEFRENTRRLNRFAQMESVQTIQLAPSRYFLHLFPSLSVLHAFLFR